MAPKALRSKVMEWIKHVCVHLCIMGGMYSNFEGCGFSTLDTVSVKWIPRSSSLLQGWSAQSDRNMPVQIYPSWVMCLPNLAIVAQIIWAQQAPQKCQGEGHSINIECQRVLNHVCAQYLPLWVMSGSKIMFFPGNVHIVFGDCSSNTADTTGLSRSRSQHLRS